MRDFNDRNAVCRLYRAALTAIILMCPLTLIRPCGAQTAADTSALNEVLVSGAAGWKITPAQYVVAGEAGKKTLAAPAGQALNLETNTAHAAPVECLMTFRLKPPAGAVGSVNLQMGSAAQALAFSVRTTAGLPSLAYTASLMPGAAAPQNVVGTQNFQAVSAVSLAWPEEMRKNVEAQIASSLKIEQTLLTMRCTVERDRFRCWLNGRFVAEIVLDPAKDPSGAVKIQASPYAEVASVRVRPLAAVARRFEPVSIDGHADSFGPDALHTDRALPGSPVNGVPFEFPAPSLDKDKRQIDVGKSWMRFGALAGFFPANTGVFGGRWTSADRIDPARISMYIPKGRYKTLHLIAASDDKQKETTPIVTAQFYRPNDGHPINFTAKVPPGAPQHVVIPLDPNSFAWFSDLDRIGLEITKEVKYFRGYPDPCEYSWHGGGLPSSVKIYAMTLERAGVEVELTPDRYAHVWTAPAAPSYTAELRNTTGAASNVKLVITTKSSDGKDTTRQEQQVALPAGEAPVKVPIALKPTLHGLHHLTVECMAGTEVTTCKRDFAYLHPDTRERGEWHQGRGSIFGFWQWAGGHVTPGAEQELHTMAAAGAETSTENYSQSKPEIAKLAEQLKFISEWAFSGHSHYYTHFYDGYPGAPKFDPAKPTESGQALVDALKKIEAKPGPVSRPEYLTFFAEPQVGQITSGIWQHHYGEEDKLSEPEQKQYQQMLAMFLAGAGAVRKEWPNLKLVFPYGDPMNTVVFLTLSPEARALIDGCALDLPGFERMPEQQVHQVVINRLYPIMKDIRQYKPDPYLVLVEGMCVSSVDLDTGQEEQADIGIRNFLLLMAYGVSRFESGNAPFDCANYWGENHYGAGWCTKLPLAMPKLVYVAYATMTRNLNRVNFSKFIPTGSLSTFCQQFKHYKNNKLVHVLWTARGKRPVTLKVDPGTTLELYDLNDNVTKLSEQGGAITFTIDTHPRYLHGLTGDAVITLGDSDHSDSTPAEHSAKIASLGDGSWKIVEKSDAEYETNKPLQIARFLGKMAAKPVDAPKDQSGKALAIHLEKQDKDRGIMPFYTTIEPASPVTIPGKSNNVGLWVHAASDWGRVVYSVRDAKGEKWISIGWKEDWNNDDIHAWSAFCFDGWRYVRFQMPSSMPYDSYREHGTSWWGSYGGDGVVDLPLKLEKIIIERRPKVIYGAELVDAKPDDVLLGDLYAEYASAADAGEEIVRLTNLRMPAPQGSPELSNPIAELEKTGAGAPTKVLNVADPAHQYDGTRCHVNFEPVAGAKNYDVWVSPYVDGRGAVKLGSAWTESGKLIEGLAPDIQFYVFVVYTDGSDKPSKPSAPFPVVLKNRFVYK